MPFSNDAASSLMHGGAGAVCLLQEFRVAPFVLFNINVLVYHGNGLCDRHLLVMRSNTAIISRLFFHSSGASTGCRR